MEIQARKPRLAAICDVENENVLKNKKITALPVKKQGVSVRGALGEIQNNAQHFQVVPSKAGVEFEKKCLKGGIRSGNYNHVQSKIDTGLSTRNALTITTKLRREESTTSLAARAVARTRAALKDTQLTKIYEKECANILVQPKKCLPKKEVAKQPTSKETKEVKKTSKPIIKEPSDSLSKLKLVETHNIDVCQKLVVNGNAVELYDSPPLPKDIEDIDANDKDNLLLMTEYIKDIYNYLTALEFKYSIKYDHLQNQNSITGKMRATLVDWLVDVHCQFSLLLETFHLAIGIIDRYLQVVPNVSRNKLQLVGVTALYIACKYEEIYAPEVGDFVYMTDCAYTKAEIFQCERDVISKLDFCLARPIPLSFLRRFIKAANGTSKAHHLAKYFVDLSLVEYTMCHYRPSELAAAAICLSLHLLQSKPLEVVWSPTLTYYSKYSLKHIMPIIKKIANIVVNVEKSKHKAVNKKYSNVTLGKVANLPQLKSTAVYELAE